MIGARTRVGVVPDLLKLSDIVKVPKVRAQIAARFFQLQDWYSASGLRIKTSSVRLLRYTYYT